MYGLLTTTGQYPSANGIQMGGADFLKGFALSRFLASMSIGGDPGTAASAQLQVQLIDGNLTEWVNVTSALLSGNNAAATGNIVKAVIGSAVRINYTAGTSPGVGANAPFYNLNQYPVDLPQTAMQENTIV